jgi:pimeloyl-ACP methyl ester carboxylesterase
MRFTSRWIGRTCGLGTARPKAPEQAAKFGVRRVTLGFGVAAAAAVAASLLVAQQTLRDGYAGASVSIRFADNADAVAGAGVAFSDIVTQSVTATASASVIFQAAVEEYNSSRRYIVAFGEDSDSDRVPDSRDQCLGTAFEADIDANGCAQSQVDQDLDGVCNAGASSPRWCTGTDSCPSTPAGTPVDSSGCAASQSLPPGVPSGLWGTVTNGRFILGWETSDPGVGGWHVYMRNTSEGAPFSRLTGTTPSTAPIFEVVQEPTGGPLVAGVIYEFALTAVTAGVESLRTDPIALRFTPQAASTRNPVVFVHGFISSADTWDTVKRYLQDAGWEFGGELTIDDGEVLLAGHEPQTAGDFFTATLPSCAVDLAGTRLCGLQSIPEQGMLVGRFLDKLKSDLFGNSQRFTIVAHSNGGLAARSYLTSADYPSRRDVDHLVVYGTPNLGAQFVALLEFLTVSKIETTPCGFLMAAIDSGAITALSGGLTGVALAKEVVQQVVQRELLTFAEKLALQRFAPAFVDAQSDSEFLAYLNGRTMPSDTRYTRIIGLPPIAATVFGPLTTIAQFFGCVEGTRVFADLASSDGIVAGYSQAGVLGTVNVFPPSGRRSIRTEAGHLRETQDVPNILLALDPSRSFQLTVRSPVTVEVTAPDGRRISRFFNELHGAAYKEFVDETGHEIGVVVIPFAQDGPHRIAVIPKPNASPTDTFTLELTRGESTTLLADSLRIEDVPSNGFEFLLDTIPPTIACGDSDGMWHSTDVQIACTAFDATSALADGADASFVLATAVPVLVETAEAATNSRTICDTAGNCATAGAILGNKVDKKAPEILISQPVSQSYAFGQAVAATYTCTDGGSGIATCAGPVGNGTNIDTGSLGPKVFKVNARDSVGNTSSLSIEYTVVAAPTVSAVTATPGVQQYSDLATFTATLASSLTVEQVPASNVTFMVGTQTLGTVPLVVVNGTRTGVLENVRLREPTPFGTTPTGQMAPGPHTVTAVFGGINPNFIVNDATTTLTIAKEDALATYTGAVFASTACVTCSTATVTLSATVQDITAMPTDPATDAQEGDIRHATVTFAIVETGQTFAGVPVGLVTTGDTRTGTATKNVAVNIGNADALALTVRVIVDGYYTGPVEQSVLNVAKPLGSSFITGGGYLLMSQSAGLYPGQAGTRNNFGFGVKYNKSGTNLQGNINTLVRNNGRVYQIKGNAMTSLSTNPSAGTATFNGKANIQDVTDPLNPISIDGNASLQVTMTDRGEPGAADGIGVSVWNKSGGLWFSSNWNGTRTLEQTLAGGNVVVR